MFTSSELRIRQHQIIDPSMAEQTAYVVGLGMVGSWVAQALSRVCGQVVGFDDDVVGVENLGTQCYDGLIGVPKADATKGALLELPFTGYVARFPDGAPSRTKPTVVVSCVDSMTARREVAKWCQRKKVPLMLDCRVLGETVALFAAFTQPQRESHEGYRRYLSELLTDNEVPDVPCGASGTAYCGMWLAARVATVINNWCKGQPVAPKTIWHVGSNADLTFTGTDMDRKEVVPLVQAQ